MKASCKAVVVENHKGIAKTCRDAARKAKALLHLKLARGVKTYKNEFLRYVNNKEKQKENIGLLSNERGQLVPSNAEKVGSQHILHLWLYQHYCFDKKIPG